MKKRRYPLYEACEHFYHCTGEKGGYRKDCGYCPLHPRAARIFTPRFLFQCFLTSFLCFLAGALMLLLVKGS